MTIKQRRTAREQHEYERFGWLLLLMDTLAVILN